jgi:hypothetical protein
MSDLIEISERLRKISQQKGIGYREAVFSVYAHLEKNQMYVDFAQASDALEARDKTIAELVGILRMVSDLSAFNHEYESYLVPLNAIVAVDTALSQAIKG